MTRSLPVIQPSSLIPEGRKPSWLKVRAPGGPNYMRLKSRMREWNLHSVCEEARCPNMGECWEAATATFMILGDVCTRNGGYCAIAHGTPVWEDREEPERIGRAVRELGLEYVVITSVNRDDLADGGGAHWAATVRAVRRHAPRDRKSTRLNSSHVSISYAVFCLKKKTHTVVAHGIHPVAVRRHDGI